MPEVIQSKVIIIFKGGDYIMNKETYEALKRIMKYGYFGDIEWRGNKEKDLKQVEGWIDEVKNEYTE